LGGGGGVEDEAAAGIVPYVDMAAWIIALLDARGGGRRQEVDAVLCDLVLWKEG
jgi:hypothetical protein